MITSRNSPAYQRARIILVVIAFAALSAEGIKAQSGVVRSRTTTTSSSQPPQRISQTPMPAGQTTVTGRVIYHDNEEPIKGVRVRIFTAKGSEQAVVAFANTRGEFRLEKVGAGKYYIALEGVGVAMPSGMGMRIPLPVSAIPRREDFEEIVPRHDAQFTADGTSPVNVEVRVKRGGAVSGKVFRPDGSAAANVFVNLVSREEVSAGPFTSQFSGMTDKNGAFRIENVPAANYLVAAALEDDKVKLDIRSRMMGEGRVVTYHPAASSARDAILVRVNPNQETSGINITLVSRNAYLVSGSVMRQRDGSPIAGATVLLRNKEAELGGSLMPGMGQRTTQTDAQGNWSFSRVTEGTYLVTALVPNSRPANQNGDEPDRERAYRESRQRFLFQQQDVNVSGADVQGLALAISGPGSIRGVVETDDGVALPRDLVIFLELVTEKSMPSRPLPVRVNGDGSFSFAGVQAGDVYVSAALAPDSKYFIESVTAGETNLRRAPLKVIEGADSEPVRIKISSGLASVAGRVLSASGEGLSGWVVLVIPADTSEQRFRTSVLSARTAPDGSYAVSGAPGDYLIFARRRDELPGIMTAEFFSAGIPDAQPITLKRAERKAIDLRINR